MKTGYQDILIIGCGSIGSALAMRLHRRLPVLVYEKNRVLFEKIRKDGVRVFKKKGISRFPLTGFLSDLRHREFRVAIFATKSYDTCVAAGQISRHCRVSAVLSLQNGLGNAEVLEHFFPDSSIYHGVITSAVSAPVAGQIRIFKEGEIFLGPYRGSLEEGVLIGAFLKRSGFRTTVLKDPLGAVWSKLIFNAVLNPLPLLVDRPYGVIRRSKDFFGLARAGIEEGKAIARRKKIRLFFDPMDTVRQIRNGRWGDFQYRGSMYEDFIRGNRIEIDQITGSLIREAQKLGVRTPVLETIYRLTKTLALRAQR